MLNPAILARPPVMPGQVPPFSVRPSRPRPSLTPVPAVPVGVSQARLIKALADQALQGITDPALAATISLIHSNAVRLEAGILHRAAKGAR